MGGGFFFQQAMSSNVRLPFKSAGGHEKTMKKQFGNAAILLLISLLLSFIMKTGVMYARSFTGKAVIGRGIEPTH